MEELVRGSAKALWGKKNDACLKAKSIARHASLPWKGQELWLYYSPLIFDMAAFLALSRASGLDSKYL